MGRDRLLRQYLRERFVVTLKSGETFDGLLDEWDRSSLSFVDCYAVGESTRIAVDGHMVLPRVNIAYMQKPGAV